MPRGIIREWTEDKIVELFNEESNPEWPRAVSRAVVAIYNRQTASEKECEGTVFQNGVGFSGSDARIGTYLAKYVVREKKALSGRFLQTGKKLAVKYRGQLAKIANGEIV